MEVPSPSVPGPYPFKRNKYTEWEVSINNSKSNQQEANQLNLEGSDWTDPKNYRERWLDVDVTGIHRKDRI